VFEQGGRRILQYRRLVGADQSACRRDDLRYPGPLRPKNGSYREQISFVTDRPGHDQRYAIDASKITEKLGWTPGHNFETGIDRTVRWYLDNETWWREILARTNAADRRGLKA
jgi:dTDP-D-glucose 4,6-dehydratase